jgi:chromosome segregation ATPase
LKDQTRNIASLTADLAQQRNEAFQAQQRHSKQHDHLYDKLAAFREEKRSWQTESARLRSELNEAQATAQRQKDELAAVKNECVET